MRLIKRTIYSLLIVSTFSAGLYAQKTSCDYAELENILDENLELMYKIQGIVSDYPSFNYKCDMDNNEITGLTIYGVNDKNNKEKLEVYLIDLENNKNKLKNQSNRMGVFYTLDKKASYDGTQKEFNRKLQDELSYPQDAKNWGVEGTIFAQFVVDENGEIPFVKIKTDEIDDYPDIYVNKLVEKTSEAIKNTSGEWKPGKLNDVDVPSLVVLPITFELEKYPFLPGFIM